MRFFTSFSSRLWDIFFVYKFVYTFVSKWRARISSVALGPVTNDTVQNWISGPRRLLDHRTDNFSGLSKSHLSLPVGLAAFTPHLLKHLTILSWTGKYFKFPRSSLVEERQREKKRKIALRKIYGICYYKRTTI